MADAIEAAALQEAERASRKAVNLGVVDRVVDDEKEIPKVAGVPTTKEFYVKHESECGTVYEGKFRSKILTIADRIAVGSMMSRMAGGMSFDSLDPLTRQLVEVVSHMQFSLLDKPEWFADILSITDMRLIEAVYKEVSAHESSFRGT